MADICILQICAGAIRVECVHSLLNAARMTEPSCDVMIRPAGPYLDAERNALWEIAMEASTADWFVWVDSDIGFTKDDLLKVTDSIQHPVTFGVYFSSLPSGYGPVVYDWKHGEFEPITEDRLKGKKRLRFDAVGAGFLAVHRSVAELLRDTYKGPSPWFDEPTLSAKKLGEDFGLCLRLRQLDIPVWVRPDVRVDHYKTMKL